MVVALDTAEFIASDDQQRPDPHEAAPFYLVLDRDGVGSGPSQKWSLAPGDSAKLLGKASSGPEPVFLGQNAPTIGLIDPLHNSWLICNQVFKYAIKNVTVFTSEMKMVTQKSHFEINELRSTRSPRAELDGSFSKGDAHLEARL